MRALSGKTGLFAPASQWAGRLFPKHPLPYTIDAVMGRLPAGQKPTPANERQLTYRQDLEASGGLRLICDIERPANDALKEIMELDEPSNLAKGVTKKEAVSNALMHYAKSLRRRAK